MMQNDPQGSDSLAAADPCGSFTIERIKAEFSAYLVEGKPRPTG